MEARLDIPGPPVAAHTDTHLDHLATRLASSVTTACWAFSSHTGVTCSDGAPALADRAPRLAFRYT
jgi:hypothetical protein